ncbi:MAG: hypothetical protein HFE94_05750 [Acutalibacter sp.]|nr:hypothetical protein [Acutalibacter sp.]
MPTEKEILIIQKAAMFDLIDILESDDGKDSYTTEELKALIRAYLKGAKD